MQAPLSNPVSPAVNPVTLDDKYTLKHGRAFMSGVQALVRLPLLQRQRDALTGLNTAGFIRPWPKAITGMPGSTWKSSAAARVSPSRKG